MKKALLPSDPIVAEIIRLVGIPGLVRSFVIRGGIDQCVEVECSYVATKNDDEPIRNKSE